MSLLCDIAQLSCIASLGVFAGAMLTEGCILVSYWRSLTPTEFFGWYGRNGQRLQGFFGPLTTITGVLVISFASLSFFDTHPGRWLALIAAISILTAISTFYLYFRRANASFATASVAPEDLPGALVRWAKWHWWRTGLSFLALATALLSLGGWK